MKRPLYTHAQYEHPQFKPSNTQQSQYNSEESIYAHDQADFLPSRSTVYNAHSMPGPYYHSQNYQSGQWNYAIQSTTHAHSTL